LVTERRGKPLVGVVTEGQRHESPQAVPLLGRMADRMWPEAVAGDRGYSSAELRNWLLHRDIEAVIPYREDELGPHDYDRELYRERPTIERTINRLKRFRRVATRYDKLAANFMAMVTIAMILEWL
jgi:transposase